MPYNSDQLEFALPLPITQMAHRTAQQFASTQPTPQKAEQVRLNTLAVYAVNDYLQIIGIPTNLKTSDSWNPIVRLCADVADLEVRGLGRLECRPVKKHQQTCYVPPEVWSDRIGYVVVQIDESYSEATVLGFAQTATSEELPISQLRSIEDLIDYLNQLMPPELTAVATTVRSTKVNLSQWFADAFETGWQAVESLLNPGEPELAFRFRSTDSTALIDQSPGNGVSRAKLIDLETNYPVALVVNVLPESEQRRNILIQVHPTSNQTYLPPLLQLTVLDESGLVFLEAQARSADNYIQLQFSGLPEEQFSIKINLGDASVTEEFVV